MNFVFMIGDVTTKPYIVSSKKVNSKASYFSIEVETSGSKFINSRTDIFNIVAYGALAIYINNNLAKGDTLILRGYIKNKELKASNSSRQIMSEIVAEHIKIIKASDSSSKNKPSKAIEYDDDIPDFVRINSEEMRFLDEAPY